ncbi:RlpA-like double-psi beta-barrel-protein domain-containing protein-containing protein [Flammula alnicola]|nr:RlpA-like double-psi beta-barrel-protein domain-containing protein-containing protein [Flammula alnicola]
MQFTKTSLAALSLIFGMANASFSGDATFFDFNGGIGACGQSINNGDHSAALNAAQYGSGFPGPECFKNINVTYQGTSAILAIVDECITCGTNGLDLTQGAFTLFAPLSAGIIPVTWDFV